MANLISNKFIEELLNRTDIVSVVGSCVSLKKKGINYFACCPFHEEKTPSFSVNQSKQFFHCFGCGLNGDVISFMMKYRKLEFVEAVEFLAKQIGLSVVYEKGKKITAEDTSETEPLYKILKNACHYYELQLWRSTEGAIARRYLLQRGIPADICKQFQLGYAPSGWDNLLKKFSSDNEHGELEKTGMVIKNKSGNLYDRYRKRILFPIHNRHGKIIGFGGRVINSNDSPKYLNSPKTILFEKSRELYGLHQIPQNSRQQIKKIIVVEGYLDVLALKSHNIPEVVATLGTATTSEHIQVLKRFTDCIIFCFDGDVAGKKAAWHALEICFKVLSEQMKIKFIFLPQGEDPDSLVNKIGQRLFEKKIDSAINITEYFFNEFKARIDLTSIEGKSQLITRANTLISTIPSSTLRYLMVDHLSKLVNMSTDRLTQLMNIDQQQQKKEVIKDFNFQTLTSNDLVFSLLLQNPSLFEHIRNTIEYKQLRHTTDNNLNILLELLEDNSNLSTNELIEFWRGEDKFERIMQLASLQHYIPKDGAKSELIGAMHLIYQQNLNKKIEKMIKKANLEGLSAEERQQLQKWIVEKKSNTSLVRPNKG